MIFDQDTVLFEFKSPSGNTPFTIKHSCEGIFCAGASGSGKTSASSLIFAKHFLRCGYGGVVLSAKSERPLWEKLCKEAGVLDKLIVVSPGGEHSFNFLNYELKNNDGTITYTENIYQLLLTVLRAGQEKSGKGGDDPFWSESLESLILHALDLVILAYGTLSIENLYNVVLSAPKAEGSNDNTKNAFVAAFEKAQSNVSRKIEEFENSLSADKRKLLEDKEIFEETILKEIPEAFKLKMIDQFFIESYRVLSPKTRSIVDHSFTTFLNQFLREPIKSLFTECKTTFTPENCYNGAIILLDIPIKKYFKIGRDIQCLFKLIFERAVEKRPVTDDTRPLFIWSDECQFFLMETTNEFQATARSSKIANVMITQNLPGLFAAMGTSKPEYRTKAFLATLGTKIFNSNACVDTNRYSSELIGDAYEEEESTSMTVSGNFSSSSSKSYKLSRMVRPEQFSGLKSGGKENDYLVEAYVHRQNHPFHDGLMFRKITFSQL